MTHGNVQWWPVFSRPSVGKCKRLLLLKHGHLRISIDLKNNLFPFINGVAGYLQMYRYIELYILWPEFIYITDKYLTLTCFQKPSSNM